MNVLLTFAPSEKRDESVAKTIYPEKPEFLDVFHVTERNEVKINSYLNPPSDIRPDVIFSELREYILEVVLTADDTVTKRVNLSFNWTGDMKTAKVYRI